MDRAICQARAACEDISSDSSFLSLIKEAQRSATDLEEATRGRKLTQSEIVILETHGNTALDWSQVRYESSCINIHKSEEERTKPIDATATRNQAEGETTSHTSTSSEHSTYVNSPWLKSIRGCSFVGPVTFSDFQSSLALPDTGDVGFPSGLYNSTLGWCVIGRNSMIKGCCIVVRCIIGEGAAIVGCGSVTCNGSTAYANGVNIAVGPETGGREVPCYANMTLHDTIASAILRSKDINKLDIVGTNDATSITTSGMSLSPQEELRHAVNKYADLVKINMTVICEGARVIGCTRVVNAFIGPFGIVQNSEVEEITLLSSESEPSRIYGGARVSDTIMQEGTSIGTGATVKNTLLLEHSAVDLYAKVTSCVVGPDTHISSGECHNTLLGPFIGFHHQSLLIATLWPLGRGNVAYGANVGSNHTSRTADQECLMGEGVFLGLSCVLKFPICMVESPYSVIAAGTQLGPQRIAFPFSLISEPQKKLGVLQGTNQLSPGWVLQHSMYTIARAEGKYAARFAAKRSNLSWRIFRPSTIRYMDSALSALEDSISEKKRICGQIGRQEERSELFDKSIHTPHEDVVGAGQNHITVKGMQDGVHIYRLHIRRYALRGLLDWCEHAKEEIKHKVPGLPPTRGERGGVSHNVPRPEMGEMSTLFDLDTNISTSMCTHSIEDRAEFMYQWSLLCREFPALVSAVEHYNVCMHNSLNKEKHTNISVHSHVVGSTDTKKSSADVHADTSTSETVDGCIDTHTSTHEHKHTHAHTYRSSHVVEALDDWHTVLADLLKTYVHMERDLARAVETSKSRDDIKGKDIIPGYMHVHTPAHEDSVVKKAYIHAQNMENRVNVVLNLLK